MRPLPDVLGNQGPSAAGWRFTPSGVRRSRRAEGALHTGEIRGRGETDRSRSDLGHFPWDTVPLTSLTGKALTLAWGGRDTVKATSIQRADNPIDATAPAALRAVTPPPKSKRPKSAFFPARAIRNALLLALLVSIVVSATILFGLNGWHYYRTPLRVRGYAAEHRLLHPAGTVGLALGISGAVLMLLMQAYSVRKRVKKLNRFGSLPRWLEFHIFCGVVGPLLITFHTSFKFNGIVSVAYWSMLLVVASGFVGRYLFVRIPKSIRGQELTYAEVEERATDLKTRLIETHLPPALLEKVEAFETRVLPRAGSDPGWRGIVFGEVKLRLRIRQLRRQIRRAGVDHRLLHDAVALIAERAVLLRRLAYLKKTKKLFELWHVFHQPLAYVMFLIVTLHVTTAIYFGYAFGR